MDNKKFCAVYVLVKNEKHFLPLWIKYYGSLFGIENLYIMDHQSIDGSTNNLPCNIEIVKNEIIHDNAWMISLIYRKQQELLKEYEYVISTDVDEFIIPDPNKYKNLYEYIKKMKSSGKDIARCFGHEVVHQRKIELNDLDWNKPILVNQRKYWINLETYNKPIISSRNVNWTVGKHYEIGNESYPFDKDLILVHLHRVDYQSAKDKAIFQRKYKVSIPKDANPCTMIGDIFDNYFDDPQHIRFGCLPGILSEIPEKFKGVL